LNNWAKDSIFYHVYPLGLCGAPARNDFSAAPVERLAGMSGWLDHIRSLGCDAIYLGPVFESSAHGYDTADYWHVDRRLGTDETLVRFVADCHARGLKVVLDGVFHHVGRDFWAFRDVLEKGEASAFRDWFADLRFEGTSPYGDPFTYQGWHGHFDLVKLNLSNPDVRNHLLEAVRSWIVDFGIDGLRLDAADVLDPGFQRNLAAHCRSIDPEFWLMGEVVHGDYRDWAGPGALDSVTNYECYKGLYSSLADRNYHEIAYALNRQSGKGGMYAALALYNFVDNHDQDRVAGKLPEARLLYPLYLLLYTMPGVPSIYYGSEWGFADKRAPGDDSPVRPALDLATAAARGLTPDLPSSLARFAALRHELPELRGGAYRQLLVAPEQLGFARTLGDGEVVVLLNAADRAIEMAVPTSRDGVWRDRLNGDTVTAKGGRLTTTVSPSWGRVLIPEEA
jgi:cyclomaltodextrinase / maltogenic alpha-amylase / neopullulanase